MNLNPDLNSGTLSDNHIRQAASQGWLIAENFEDICIRQACYELRSGNIYYELDRADRDTNPLRHELKADQHILLKPKQFITIITHETVKLPPYILGRVLTKGQLFSIGIIPVNTYADPGFEGQLGIVLANLSNNYLKIPQLEPIAKIEFSKLRQSVAKPYVGQHGFQSRMWPVPYHMVMTPEEVSHDPRVKKPLDELEAIQGYLFAKVAKRVFRFERYLLLSAVCYFLLSTIILAFLVARQDRSFTITVLFSVAISVVSNFVFFALTYLATSIKR
jgi:dCTP deaminase